MIFFWGTPLLLGITYPITPSKPEEPNVVEEKKIDSSKETKQSSSSDKKSKLSSFDILVYLGSGDMVQGTVLLPEKISFKHYKNGFIYYQTLFLKDVKEIDIKEYNYKILTKKKSKTIYEFFPSKVFITTKKDNYVYHISSLFKEMLQFKINTKYGITNLFAFFSDTFSLKKGWEEVVSKNKNYHKKNPHPKSVVKIMIHEKK